jgi:hypothetical protein
VKRFLPIVLLWTLPPAGCNTTTLELYDAYITGPGTNNYADGARLLPPTQTSFDLAVGKPHLGCVVAYRFPVAKSNGQLLPPECQPSNFSADGMSWEGM